MMEAEGWRLMVEINLESKNLVKSMLLSIISNLKQDNKDCEKFDELSNKYCKQLYSPKCFIKNDLFNKISIITNLCQICLPYIKVAVKRPFIY